MFEKILIANRGEIALRVIRAAREMGIKSVAVHSTADTDAMHVRMADESVCIGPAPSSESYLSKAAIISACEITGAQAVHPGYGFLSENAAFAQALEDHGITFIGPSAEHIRIMGDKITAKETAKTLGIPVVPGSDGGVPDCETAEGVAAGIGYPVIIKATAGGGGRGMKVAKTPEELEIYGHAIEVRINAEKLPNFAPCPGKVTQYHAPGGLGVRMDSALYDGYRIPPYYDSLIGKLIVHGRDRPEALARLQRALGELIVDGVDTTIPLFRELLENPDIQKGDYSIHWLEKWLAAKAAANAG